MDDKVARREMRETGAAGRHLRRKLFAIAVVHMKTLSKIKRNLGAAVPAAIVGPRIAHSTPRVPEQTLRKSL